MSSSLPHSRVRDFLAQQTTVTLATLNPDGTVQACDLFYAASTSFSFYFLSDPKTAHIQNITQRPHVSATVHGHARGWQDIRGVQIVGTAGRVEGAVERAQGYALYLSKFVFVGQWLPTIQALGQRHPQFGLVELYKILPRWLRWIDNTQSFGYKEEWEFSSPP